MKSLLILLLLVPTVVFTALGQEPKLYSVPDVEAVYPGGIDSLKAFLERNIVYPEVAVEDGIEGKTYLTFIVSVDGTITNPVVRRGLAGCPECDAEALRVVKLMPKWIPAQLNSKNIESQYTLAVKFTPPVNSVYNDPEEWPQFPGGEAELKRFLAQNIMYPQRAVEEGLSGICRVQFMVAEDGTITNPVVIRGVVACPECDVEAIRVVKLMPKWTPGKVEGKAVNSIYNLPISFYLQ